MNAPLEKLWKEINLDFKDEDLNCFGYISEKSYEGMGHWLMFLFKSMVNIETILKQLTKVSFNFFFRVIK